LAFFFCSWLANSSLPGEPDGYINSGGMGSASSGQLLGSIAEPVTGLLKDGWQHCLQGFVYKTLDIDFATDVSKLPMTKQLNVSLYPNPVKEFVFVKLEGDVNQQLNYSIFTQDGRIIKNGFLEGKLTQIDLSDLVSTYYLFILTDSSDKMVLNKSKILIAK
ncbi:MAG: T9SS type A sorting domain-containing protein, partial [Desulfobacterales bacterium]|nr:T9SS type A sorting domain-containing protein [Desulfobacterales bacterium]